jgi:hypothetical protein
MRNSQRTFSPGRSRTWFLSAVVILSFFSAGIAPTNAQSPRKTSVPTSQRTLKRDAGGETILAPAAEVTFAGYTNGCFNCNPPPNTSATQTASIFGLTWTNSIFSGTSSGGFFGLGGNPTASGVQNIDNLGSITLANSLANYNGNTFTLRVSFTAPTGIAGSNTALFTGSLVGSVTSTGAGGVEIDFNNTPQLFTYTNGAGPGSFFLSVNDITVNPGQTADISGQITGASQTVTFQAPSAAVDGSSDALLTAFTGTNATEPSPNVPAAEVSLAGYTNGCFNCNPPPVPNTSATQTATIFSLTWTNSQFSGTTSAGFFGLGGNPTPSGVQNVDNLGSITLGNSLANYTGANTFTLRVSFTAPTGINGGGSTLFTGTLNGSVTSTGAGGVEIDFNNTPQLFTYSIGGSSGSFFLSVNDITVNPGQTTALNGQITSANASAAHVSIDGRVISSAGNPIANARVMVASPDGSAQSALTNAFGYFKIENVEVGQMYVLTVQAKRYSFTPQLVPLTDPISGMIVIAN